jgi:MtN3 and saliva related transmembrane protein
MTFDTTQIIGIIAGLLTAFSMMPQLIKVIKEKEVKDISALMLATLIAGVSCWVVYGVLLGDVVLIATNSFSLISNLLLLFFRFRYASRQ